MAEIWIPVFVVLLGYVVLGLTGFGSALVVVPLLAWQWPLPEVVALTLLLDVPASAFHSGLNWRWVKWAELRRLLPGMVLGTLVGLWLVQHMDSRWPLM
ncbi:MAG: sulfite exporter TauE/SafE family protein, partial [Betaproteobacteria bacterium]|nr:sulfite exporter TauE/SafE family protein [Betaproteobacteria bacterium]